MSGGLYMASQRLRFLNSESRIKGLSVWESFVYILNGMVFLLIGLELPEIVDGIRSKGIPVSTATICPAFISFIQQREAQKK